MNIGDVRVSGEIIPNHAIINGKRRRVGYMARIRCNHQPMVGDVLSNGIANFGVDRVDQSATGYSMLLSSV